MLFPSLVKHFPFAKMKVLLYAYKTRQNICQGFCLAFRWHPLYFRCHGLQPDGLDKLAFNLHVSFNEPDTLYSTITDLGSECFCYASHNRCPLMHPQVLIVVLSSYTYPDTCCSWYFIGGISQCAICVMTIYIYTCITVV